MLNIYLLLRLGNQLLEDEVAGHGSCFDQQLAS